MRMRTVHAEPQWNLDSVSIFCVPLVDVYSISRSRSKLQNTTNYTVYCQSQKRTIIVVQGKGGGIKPMARLCVVDKRWGHNVKQSGKEIMT